jgi:hypothetical protein
MSKPEIFNNTCKLKMTYYEQSVLKCYITVTNIWIAPSCVSIYIHVIPNALFLWNRKSYKYVLKDSDDGV